MNLKFLKPLRLVVSLFFLVVAALIFLDFRHEFSDGFISSFLFLQFAPSVIKLFQVVSVSALGFIIVLILTFIFGRVYCSTICPLGIFQDAVSWISIKMRRKKWPYKYSVAHNALRYSLLLLTIVFLLFGSILLLNLLDPYSNFGRFVTYFANPVVVDANNLLSPILTSRGVYSVFPVSIPSVRWEIIVFPALMLVLVLWLSFKHGRLYCNSICPVGTLLGYVSKISLIRIFIDEKSCTRCGRCDRICKSSCINFRAGEVDFSRCVACYNCLTVCPDNAIKYSWEHKSKTSRFDLVETGVKLDGASESKRNFLLSSLIMLLGISRFSRTAGNIPRPEQETIIPENKHYPVSPPGSISITDFNKACTACTLCVSACPTHVLQPSLLEYGIGGFLQPRLDFRAGFCNFDCTRCGDVCPTGAILPLEIGRKHVTQVGVVKFEKENCVVFTDNTSCGACSEHCPTKACDMVPYIGELTIPEVNESTCIGCGACEYICPTRPYRAIYVDGNLRHETADKPDTEKVDMEVDFKDFPF